MISSELIPLHFMADFYSDDQDLLFILKTNKDESYIPFLL